MRTFFALSQLFYHDLLISYRHFSQLLQGLIFFLILLCLFPFLLTQDKDLLQNLAPGLVTIGILFSILLGLPHFLQIEYETGSLQNLLLSPYPLPLLLLMKILAYWFKNILPLILVIPIISPIFYLPFPTLKILLIALLWGTPTLCILGGTTSSFTLSLNQHTFLLSFITFPLALPIMIFITHAVTTHNTLPHLTNGPLWLLAALALLAFTLGPLTMAAALRMHTE